MTVDPRIGFYLSLVLAIFTTLAALGTQFTTLFGPTETEQILAILAIVNAVGAAVSAVLHAIPSQPGDAAKFLLGPKT